MSGTDLPDENDLSDPVGRALRADARRWRASHPAPSLDDVVRRLVAEDGAPARHRTGWWRPLAVAAAVLLLLGGAVTIVGLRHRSPPPPASTTTGEPAPFSAGTLTVPGGFVEASGHVVSPIDAIIGKYTPEPLQKAVRSWVSDREIGVWRVRMHESLILTAVVPDPGPAPVPAPVSSSPQTVDSSVWPDGSVTTVTWVAGGRHLTLVYSGPVAGSAQGLPLTEAEVVAIAQTYQLGSSSTVPSPVHPTVPVTVAAGSSTLVLEETRSFSARRGPSGELLVSLAGGPSSLPGTATYCRPFEQAVLTGATARSVTVTVADYTPTSGRDLPCTAEAYLGRWVPVTLDGPLGSRTVIDGSTGRPVSLTGP